MYIILNCGDLKLPSIIRLNGNSVNIQINSRLISFCYIKYIHTIIYLWLE